MCCTSVFACKLAMVSNFFTFFIFSKLFLGILFHKCYMLSPLGVILAPFFVNGNIFFSKLITFVTCSLRQLKNFFIQCSPRYILCLSSILSNAQMVDIEYLQGLYSPIFIVEDFSELFVHAFVFIIKD